MPRFGTKTLLIGFALAAVWLSTFGGYPGADDVRRSVLLLALVAAAFVAIYAQGRRRAFWAGFTVVMLLCGGFNLQRPLGRYVPDFNWIWSVGSPTPFYTPAPVAPPPVPMTSRQPPAPQYRYALPTGSTYVIPNAVSTIGISPAANDTIAAVWTFVLSLLGGLVVAFIYAQTHTHPTEPR